MRGEGIGVTGRQYREGEQVGLRVALNCERGIVDKGELGSLERDGVGRERRAGAARDVVKEECPKTVARRERWTGAEPELQTCPHARQRFGRTLRALKHGGFEGLRNFVRKPFGGHLT